MIRCFLLKELMHEIRTGTWGIVLHRVPDGRLKIKFDGYSNCHLVPERFVRIFPGLLLVLLVLLSVPAFSLPIIQITISTQADPAESIPAGWCFEGASYDSDSLEFWESAGPEDSPLVSVSFTIKSPGTNVKIKSISISLTADVALLLSILATKNITLEFPDENSNYPVVNNNYLPVFDSVFEPNSSYHLAR